jgi:hypothetical protein
MSASLFQNFPFSELKYICRCRLHSSPCDLCVQPRGAKSQKDGNRLPIVLRHQSLVITFYVTRNAHEQLSGKASTEECRAINL